MSLFEWWVQLPERLAPRVPALLKIVFLLWMLIGLVIAVVPELHVMPTGARFALGAAAALGILYMAVGMLLKIVDAVINIVARLTTGGAR